VNCGNNVCQIASLLPARDRSRPHTPAAGRCLVHVGCTGPLAAPCQLGNVTGTGYQVGLPFFRRISTSTRVHYSPPEQDRRRISRPWRPWPSSDIHTAVSRALAVAPPSRGRTHAGVGKDREATGRDSAAPGIQCTAAIVAGPVADLKPMLAVRRLAAGRRSLWSARRSRRDRWPRSVRASQNA
jgi:hypothetical protein